MVFLVERIISVQSRTWEPIPGSLGERLLGLASTRACELHALQQLRAVLASRYDQEGLWWLVKFDSDPASLSDEDISTVLAAFEDLDVIRPQRPPNR